MKMLIDIDDALLASIAARGFEVAGEFRKPASNETIVSAFGVPSLRDNAKDDIEGPRLILRPAWVWPSALGPNVWGIAADKDGVQYAYTCPAELAGNAWKTIDAFDDSDQHPCMDVADLAIACGFNPPTIKNWKTPVLNPNYNGPSGE